jgi:protein-S-isoprenylcysteine O-methyltransferase Ste14
MTGPGNDNPGVVARPPLIFLGCLIAGFAVDWFSPLSAFDAPGSYAYGGLLLGAGIVLMAWGVTTFGRAGTNIPTNRPSITVVSNGPYGFSRNPIYIGMFLIYAGIAVLADNPWLLILVVPLYFIMRYGVIAREERYLEGKFGEAYLAYKRRVRRWL